MEPAHVVTEVLSAAVDGRGRSALPWALAPLGEARTPLVMGGPAGPVALWLGSSPPGARAAASALPVRSRGVDGLALVLSLPHLRDLDAAFAEIRRVLRPAGTLVVLVPSGTVRTRDELRFARPLAPVRKGAWTNRSALDRADWLLAAADYAVLGDERVPFGLPLPDAAAAARLARDLPASGLWPSSVPSDTAERLAALAGPGRRLPVPLRRLVARR